MEMEGCPQGSLFPTCHPLKAFAPDFSGPSFFPPYLLYPLEGQTDRFCSETTPGPWKHSLGPWPAGEPSDPHAWVLQCC